MNTRFQGFVADGESRLAQAKFEDYVRRRLENTSVAIHHAGKNPGYLKQLWIRLKIAREVRRKIRKELSPHLLYLTSRSVFHR